MSEYKYNFTFEPTATKGSRVKGIASRPEEDEDNTPSFMDTFYESLSSFFSSPDEAKRVLSSKKSEEVDADLVYDEYEAGLSLKSEPVRTLEMVDDLGEQARRSSEEAALLRQEAGITQSLGPKEVINEAPEVTADTDVDSVSTSKAEEDSAPVTAETTSAGLMSLPAETPLSFSVPEFESYESAEEMSDLEILARTIEAEASGESFEGKIAVGSVIANRVASGSYGGSGGIKGVILKKGQFSPWNSYTGYAKGEQGKDMLNFKASKASYKAANDILTGNYTDETGGASHYVNPKVSTPNWLPDMKARKRGTVTIGNHLFGNADNEKIYDGKSGIAELSSETTDQPLVAQAPTVKAIQRIVGTSADGQFGSDSRKKALSYLSNEGVDVPKDATNKQLMDLVINRPKAPLTPNISLPKVEESTTTEAVLDVVSQSVPQEVLYNPLAYIKENNLIGLDERTTEGAKAIDGFFKTATPQGLNALKMKGNNVSSTKNAWCAVFVDHVLRTMGAPALDPTTSPRGKKDKKQRRYAAMRAFEYANYGDAVKTDQAQAGDLVIMKGSHIGFYTGEKDAKGNYLVLGGNQSTKGSYGRGVSVNVAPYALSDVKEIRRITDVANIPADEIKAMTATITGTDEAAGEGS